VRGITNLITVKAPMTQPSPDEVKRRIKDTLARGAQFDADRIQVEVQGHRAVLTGTVRSYAERRDAERAALNAPGITDVENHIIVDPNVFAAV
jgi:osmotically-inducible protein OsmY